MDERLKRYAEAGDVDALYSIISQDPDVVETLDRIPLIDTPLHTAASAGNTHFAMEMASLKPSFAWKLNSHGLSPMHLALQNGHDQLVTSMVTLIDSDLVRVKAKGRITPLHYVAEMENNDLLAEFLSACPSSIEDLTVRCETAVHVAVKNGRLSAFKVLLGWLRRVNKEEILKWKDEDGNTVLHIATSTNQPEVMKLLMGTVNVNAKNFSGQTAMDIFHLQGDSQDSKVGKILHRVKAKKSSQLSGSSTTLAGYFIRDLTLIEKRDKYFGIIGQNQEKSMDGIRNIVLVVAVLIATATYQAGLSPPGGYWQDDFNPQANNSATASVGPRHQVPHRAGQMIMGPFNLFNFFTLNSAAFYASVWTILILITGLPYAAILSTSTCFLLCAYFASLSATFPSQDNPAYKIVRTIYMNFTYVFLSIVYIIPVVSSNRLEILKRRVDNLKRRVGGFT
ncbi:hypothetical protein ACOSP7_019771 [Xanthoceras sorbifolium]|uniref:PGG domain-containing protein n=1 Tax=Xanthoceras sorbifolium TaxID=99658 RepID=A0ABQ8I3A0_9ROSI|nr:hypothetical protein JRO89_XS05G0257400 [Xanthoceras sorbifolium]